MKSAMASGMRFSTLLLFMGCLAARAADPAAVHSPSGPPGQPLPGASQPRTPAPAAPGTKSPAETVRELLAMTPAEREQALSDRTPKQRAAIELSLREYEALPVAEREARLKQLVWTWHVGSLMKLAPAKRGPRLAAVPADLRAQVEEKLREFDRLPAAIQQQVLTFPTTANYFLGTRSAPPPIPGQSSAPPIPGAHEGGRLAEHISQFLELSEKEQQKILETLPAPEREEMRRTLKAFSKLPPEQRLICINSFERFARLNKEQRDQFFKNAARWKAMSERERETWRTLIEIVPPGGEPAASAPLPPSLDSTVRTAAASNGPATPISQEQGH